MELPSIVCWAWSV